eukprot:Gb_11121 [translate_table: standard]
MENINPTELLRHLEKESEVLRGAHDSISYELRKLQVEEEMLMRTFHNLLSAQGLIKKRESTVPIQEVKALIAASSGEGYFAARKSELDTCSDEASWALVTTSEVGNCTAEGSQTERNLNQISMSLAAAPQEDENGPAERSNSDMNHNQTPQPLMIVYPEDECCTVEK